MEDRSHELEVLSASGTLAHESKSNSVECATRHLRIFLASILLVHNDGVERLSSYCSPTWSGKASQSECQS